MDNTFVYGEPLSGERGFYNRRSEIMRVASRIGADRPQSVSIVAEPRMGKSSLLNWLRNPDVRSQYLEDPGSCVILYMDLGNAATSQPGEFFASLSETWQQTGEERFDPSFDGFSSMVRALMAEGRRLLLFLDDFGLVTQNSGFPLGFFSFMRSVANSNDVGYVTTSTSDLQKLCHTQDIEESPFFNIFTTVHLEPFKEQDALTMVTELAAACCDSIDEPQWVADLAGGSPYLLQLAGHQAVELQRRGKLSRDALADAAYRAGRAHMEELWDDNMSPVQQEVMRGVQQGAAVERKQEYAAESLERRGHLKRTESGYAVRAELMSRFVSENGSGGIWKRIFG
jgi:eukaryotic-like serine/threonine-protein kinase